MKNDLISAAKREIAGWRNDTGSHPQHFSQDMGQQAYNNAGAAVEVSLPHILNINNAFAGSLTVNLFGAASNYTAANFGNNVNITVTYTSNNPLVPFTYGQLLATTLTEAIQVGLIRVQSTTNLQLTQTLSLLRNQGVGKFEGQSLFPLIYPNQFQSGITYVQGTWKADKFTTLSYLQNGATDPNVQMYFYANANTELARAFSNRRVVQEYLKPQTGIDNTINLQVAGAGQGGLL